MNDPNLREAFIVLYGDRYTDSGQIPETHSVFVGIWTRRDDAIAVANNAARTASTTEHWSVVHWKGHGTGPYLCKSGRSARPYPHFGGVVIHAVWGVLS